jgi:uncharacterized protein YeaO (DUF488 family)
MPVGLKRAYDRAARNDGFRVLVDRVWPRGIRKDQAHVDAWMKDVAPSSDLRKWFAHDPAKWEEFKDRYFAELDRRPGSLAEVVEKARQARVTLIFGAKEKRYNNAVALKEYLEQRFGL